MWRVKLREFAIGDRYNEVIKQDGWELDNYRANPVVLDSHDYSSFSRIIGRALSVDVKDGKLINRVEFCLDNPLGLLAWKMARGGFVKTQSVGFIPLEWVNGNGQNEPSRTYLRSELLENSIVAIPANPGVCRDGLVAAVKSGAVTRDDLSAVVKFLSQFCNQECGGVRKPGQIV